MLLFYDKNKKSFETTIGPFLIRKFAHPQGVWTFAILAKIKQRLQRDEKEIRLTYQLNTGQKS